MFSGLRQNSLFYILEKNEQGLDLKIGQVVSVSNPQSRYGQYGTAPNYAPQQEMVVDVKVRLGEDNLDFKQLPAINNIANSGNVIVSDNVEAMNAEVDGILRTSQQVIESVPYHETIIRTGDNIKRQLNPRFAKEKEQEEKIGALEEKMGGIEDTLNNMMGMLSKALNKNPNKKMEE